MEQTKKNKVVVRLTGEFFNVFGNFVFIWFYEFSMLEKKWASMKHRENQKVVASCFLQL